MAELTERTPTRAHGRPVLPARHRPKPPEAALPGLKAEHADKVAVDDDDKEEKGAARAARKLRLSRKDVVREQKTAGHTARRTSGNTSKAAPRRPPSPPPFIPLSRAPPAQRARPAGTWSAEPIHHDAAAARRSTRHRRHRRVRAAG